VEHLKSRMDSTGKAPIGVCVCVVPPPRMRMFSRHAWKGTPDPIMRSVTNNMPSLCVCVCVCVCVRVCVGGRGIQRRKSGCKHTLLIHLEAQVGRAAQVSGMHRLG